MSIISQIILTNELPPVEAAHVAPDLLAKKNYHPRDDLISFEEGPHIYTVNGERGTYMSTTTWIHRHFSHFDADKIIDKILSGKKWAEDPAYKYYKMTKQEIKKMWDDNRDAASSAGTNMHYDIECFYNEMDVTNESIEFTYFLEFQKAHSHLVPYRTEWMVFHEEIKISGSIDMIFENPDGTLQIYDWKRSNEIVKENNFGESALTHCIRHLPDTNYWHYSLQLNMYKRILEEKYGKIVTDLFLICLHPNNSTYLKIEVPVLTKEMDDLFVLRKKEITPKVSTFYKPSCQVSPPKTVKPPSSTEKVGKYGGFLGHYDFS